MAARKFAVSMDQQLLEKLDRLVQSKTFENRSQAVEVAVREKIERMGRTSLASECEKLDPSFERAMAEEGLSEELTEWPEY